MKLTYKNNKLEKSLTIDKEIIRYYGQLAKKIKQRITELQEADNLAVIATLPSMRLHPYKGDRKGEWSIDIFKNWRICFEIANQPIPNMEDAKVDLAKVTSIKIMSVEDPH
ncbi:MAG: type II toxin-antitoxin system RelE/ParE family toxin [Maribacter arcticus]|uniref:type II toxin-antitoxin system RelE/ParE family toxin n=1 Tax=Maribacter arcticus TaxID=561365 RepID=UPI003001EF5E